jgi:hypothetical protein
LKPLKKCGRPAHRLVQPPRISFTLVPMPRKSKAERELAPYIRPTEVLSLPPPTTLSEPARTVWIELVSAHGLDHFQEGDVTLLQQYCEASSLATRAAVALQAGDDTRLKIWERSTAVMASLSLRLRIGPQARREKAKAPKTLSWSDRFALEHDPRRQDGRARPWED